MLYLERDEYLQAHTLLQALESGTHAALQLAQFIVSHPASPKTQEHLTSKNGVIHARSNWPKVPWNISTYSKEQRNNQSAELCAVMMKDRFLGM